MLKDRKVFLIRAQGVDTLELSSAHTEVNIFNGIAKTTISHMYKNISQNALETQFSFPVNADMAISRLLVISDGVQYEAKIVDKKEADEKYNDTVAAGGSAFQLNYDSRKDNIVVMNIGSLAPEKELEVQMTVVQTMKVRFNQWYFSLASNFVPRVIDEAEELNLQFAGKQQMAQVQQELKTTKEQEPYSLEVNIKASGEITYFDVPSHELIEEEKDGKTCTFKVDTSKGDDKNFEMFYNYEGYREPRVLIQRNLEYPDQAALMVNFFPDFEGDDLSTENQTGLAEYVFLLDRSGSMSGTRIGIAKKVLVQFLEALPTGSKFNVMSFGSHYELLNEEAKPVTEEFIKEAIQQVNKFSADMGGTDIHSPMKKIFKQKRELPLCLFALTDGHVSSKDQVIQEMYANVAQCRAHTFGIGNGVDQALVKKLAIAGKGSYHLMEDAGATLKERVLLALERAKEPAFSNLSVNWPSKAILQGPKNQQIVFNHQPFCQFGIVEDQFTEGGKVELKGIETVKMEEVKFEIDLAEAVEMEYGNELFSLCTKWAINELELENPRDQEKILKLSVEYQVLSAETAFLAIEKTTTAVQEAEMKTLTLELLGENEQPVFGGTRKPSQIFAQVPRNSSGGALGWNANQSGANLFSGGTIFSSANTTSGFFAAPAPPKQSQLSFSGHGKGLFGSIGAKRAPSKSQKAPSTPKRAPRARPATTSLRETKKKKAQVRAADKAKRGRQKAVEKRDADQLPAKPNVRSTRSKAQPPRSKSPPKAKAQVRRSKSPPKPKAAPPRAKSPAPRSVSQKIKRDQLAPKPQQKAKAVTRKKAPAASPPPKSPKRKPLLGMRKAPEGEADLDKLYTTLIKAQNKEGFWTLDDAFIAAIVGITDADPLEIRFPRRAMRPVKREEPMQRVWATMVALYVLEHNFPTKKAKDSVRRANLFLDKYPKVEPDLGKIFEQ